MQRCCIWSAIRYTDLDQDIFGGGLRVFNENIEIAVIIEHAGINQLILWISPTTLLIVRAARSSYGNAF